MESSVPQVGDPVRVFDVNGHWYGQPEDGWPGTVTKVGRKLITIERYDSRQVQVFRLDTGAAVGENGRGVLHQFFLTVPEAAARARRLAAEAILQANRVALERCNTLTLDQIEAIANLLASWQPAGDAEGRDSDERSG